MSSEGSSPVNSPEFAAHLPTRDTLRSLSSSGQRPLLTIMAALPLAMVGARLSLFLTGHLNQYNRDDRRHPAHGALD